MRAEIDTAEMPAAEAAGIEAAVGDLAGHTPAEPPRPDGFRYEITPLDAPEAIPVVVNEHEIPAPLKDPIKRAIGAAKPEPRKGG
jgi:hypothetical protein